MLCGLLRHLGRPARVRCGFASYFTANPWEDHWICEYWSSIDQRWRRADAQLDETIRQRLGISFDTNNLQPDKFITAGEAWRACRQSGSEPEKYGHGTARGLWFIQVNVVRDHYGLSHSEISDWDLWRCAVGRHEHLSKEELEQTDHIALDPERVPRLIVRPPWQN